MRTTSHSKQVFEKIDYSKTVITDTEFDSCVFKNCNFSHCDLSNNDFLDCRFESCNLSMVKAGNTAMRNAEFLNCKVVGLDFSRCAEFLFAVGFKNCTLNYSSFFKRKLKKTIFDECIIREANFTEADLAGVSFTNCDLLNTVFNHTNLGGADLTTAINYSISPEFNNIKKAKFSLLGIRGLLDNYDITIE